MTDLVPAVRVRKPIDVEQLHDIYFPAKQEVCGPNGGALPVDIAGLSIPAHDYISLGYTGSNLTSVVYRSGGAGGTTVATLTLGYTGSNLTSVTKS